MQSTDGSGRVSGWVTSWGAALQSPDGADDPELSGAILRQTIRLTLDGSWARLRLSNEVGQTSLCLDAVGVARARAAGAREIGSTVLVRFGGMLGATIAPGTRLLSDPFPVPPGVGTLSDLAVTIRLRPGQPVHPVTTHPGSRTTSHVVPADAVAPDCPASALVGDPVLPEAVPVEHWYLLAALEVLPDNTGPAEPAALVLLGDSLTDGRGSTTDGNDRWPDQLADRLHRAEGLAHLAVVNQAAGGNRVLRDGLGIAAVTRLERDVLSVTGARWLIVFEGVNDIGTAQATPEDQHRVGDELVAAYEQIVRRCHERGISVFGATITPFGGHEYDDADGLREATRARVNAWIRESGVFDGVLDFDAAVRDGQEPWRVRKELHVGDGLHLNPAGYQALAAAVPVSLLTR